MFFEQIRLEQSVNIFGIYLSRRIELILITHFFKPHNILRVLRDTATVPPLMKEVLGNENDTYITVMLAFRK